MHRLLTVLLLPVALALAACATTATPTPPYDPPPLPQQPQVAQSHATLSPGSGLGAFTFLDAHRAWVVSGAQLLFSADGGLHFASLAELPAIATALGFADDQHGWAATDKGLYASSDGGKTWSKSDLKLPGQVAALSFGADGHGALVGTEGSLITRDGRTWQRVETGCKADQPAQWRWLGGDSASLACAGELRLTTDAGKTWRPVPPACGGDWFSFVSTKVGFALCPGQPGAGMQQKDLFATTDGGEHWQQVAGTHPGQPQTGEQLPAGGYAAGLFFLDAEHGWLPESRGGLYATADGGRTWQPLPVPPAGEEHFLSAVRFLTAQRGYVVSENGGQKSLLGTADGGQSWSQLYPAPSP